MPYDQDFADHFLVDERFISFRRRKCVWHYSLDSHAPSESWEEKVHEIEKATCYRPFVLQNSISLSIEMYASLATLERQEDGPLRGLEHRLLIHLLTAARMQHSRPASTFLLVLPKAHPQSNLGAGRCFECEH